MERRGVSWPYSRLRAARYTEPGVEELGAVTLRTGRHAATNCAPAFAEGTRPNSVPRRAESVPA